MHQSGPKYLSPNSEELWASTPDKRSLKPLRSVSCFQRSDVNTEPWSVWGRLGYLVKVIHQVITNESHNLCTLCLYFLPFTSKNRAAEKWLAVLITCSTAMLSKNFKFNGNSLPNTSLSSVSIQTLNLMGAFSNFWQTTHYSEISF